MGKPTKFFRDAKVKIFGLQPTALTWLDQLKKKPDFLARLCSSNFGSVEIACCTQLAL